MTVSKPHYKAVGKRVCSDNNSVSDKDIYLHRILRTLCLVYCEFETEIIALIVTKLGTIERDEYADWSL